VAGVRTGIEIKRGHVSYRNAHRQRERERERERDDWIVMLADAAGR
jgi:hypothetical protein